MSDNFYLKNKPFLLEIHKSKISYSQYLDPKYTDYHKIVENKEEITPELLEEVLKDIRTPKGRAKPQPDFLPEDIVFRVMTEEHIPLDPLRKRKPKNCLEPHAWTNFPPYKHYIVKDGNLVEVGRSHWDGDFETGTFTISKGQMTRTLVKMFELLIYKYSTRKNWRNYCVDEETEILTQEGWKNCHTITETDKVLSYDQEDKHMKWSSLRSIYRNPDYDDKLFHLTITGMDALVTPNHKFITTKGPKTVDLLLEKDSIVMLGKELLNDKIVYPDDLVELVGWTITEGNFYKRKQSTYSRVSISQNKGPKADRIRNCLNNLGFSFSERVDENKSSPFTRNGESIRFLVNKEGSVALEDIIIKEGKTLPMSFLLNLTHHQRTLLIDTMIAADGNYRFGKYRTYNQKNKDHVDMFRILCALSGVRTSEILTKTPYGEDSFIYTMNLYNTKKTACVESIDFHGGKRNGTIKGRGKHLHPNEPTVDYKGMVWCVETEYGSFLCKRNGTIYLTGNSYVAEMRANTMLHIVKTGLAFNEARGNNPFAFYTRVMLNCFRGVLKAEKLQQAIKDALLISMGETPSFSKQVEHENLQYNDDVYKAVRAKNKTIKVTITDYTGISTLSLKVGDKLLPPPSSGKE